ncbi:MAG: DUF763 domain-containing protein [Zestosphaera sp.]
MTGVSGVADLPLHGGHVPPWLAKLMLKLSRGILEVMLTELSGEEVLRRFSNPLWFQAFNNVIGMDWDSSGSTTVTTAMIKTALSEIGGDVRVAGGKGAASRRTPEEIMKYGGEVGLSTAVTKELIKVSRLGAKTDATLLQDGFTLYHHVLIFDGKGDWVIIQQGMNTNLMLARRYHLAWFMSRDPTMESHTGVASDVVGKPLNLATRDSVKVRTLVVDLAQERPESVVRNLRIVNTYLKGVKTLTGLEPPRAIVKTLPYYRPINVNSRMLNELRAAYELRPRSVEELLLIKDLGAEAVRALALISELIYREPPPLRDIVTHSFSPFKYAYTIGGKDGIPYPVKEEVARAVINELSRLINEAKLEGKERLAAFRALKRLAPADVGEI